MRWFVSSLCLLSGTLCLSAQEVDDLPDAPSVHMLAQQFVPSSFFSPNAPVIATPPPCTPESTTLAASLDAPAAPATSPCAPPVPDLYSRFANDTVLTPMTVGQKGRLALYDIFEPVNLLTIGLTAAFNVGLNSHTAYGPGMRGWGRDMGYTFAQDATGEMLGTFAISSIAHEDPRYHRDPYAPTMKRILHAISHTYVAQHDDGRAMPNYRVLAGYPLCAEASNLYVPGIASNSRSTMKRIVIGIAANPIDDLITEFLPDVATHIHLRVVFVHRVLNRVTTGQSGSE